MHDGAIDGDATCGAVVHASANHERDEHFDDVALALNVLAVPVRVHGPLGKVRCPPVETVRRVPHVEAKAVVTV